MKSGMFAQAFRQRLCRIGLFAGACGIIAGVVTAANTLWFLAHSLPADATIVSIRATPDPQPNTTFYTPVFAFTASDGHTYTVTSGIGSNTPPYAPGQHVPIRYGPSQPSAAKIATVRQMASFPLVFGSAGLLFCLMGWLLLRAERRRDPDFTPFGPPRQIDRPRGRSQ